MFRKHWLIYIIICIIYNSLIITNRHGELLEVIDISLPWLWSCSLIYIHVKTHKFYTLIMYILLYVSYTSIKLLIKILQADVSHWMKFILSHHSKTLQGLFFFYVFITLGVNLGDKSLQILSTEDHKLTICYPRWTTTSLIRACCMSYAINMLNWPWCSSRGSLNSSLHFCQATTASYTQSLHYPNSCTHLTKWHYCIDDNLESQWLCWASSRYLPKLSILESS